MTSRQPSHGARELSALSCQLSRFAYSEIGELQGRPKCETQKFTAEG